MSISALACRTLGTGAALVSLAMASLPSPAIAQDGAAKGGAAEAAESSLPDFENLDGDDAIRMFNSQRGRWSREPCEFGVPLLEVMLEAEPENSQVQFFSLYAAAFCADEEERFADGAELMREIRALRPDNPIIGLSLYFANRMDDADMAFEVLSWLDKDSLGKLNAQTLWPATRVISQNGRTAEFEALALSWFDDNLIGFIDGDLHAGLARNALAAAAREGRTEVADQMLAYITRPSTYIDMLTSRDYEVVWPQIEQRAGPNLETIGAENIEIAQRRLTNAPSDRDRFSDAAYALHFHGDFEEAVALAQTWRTREERGIALEEGDAWALNIQAYAYDSLGQPELADAVFEELGAIDPDGNNWVVSFLINRASRLIGHGRWAEGLAATQLARTVRGSTFAEMIVAKDHACALNQLGRADEALVELDFLRENRVASVHLAAQGLLCHGLQDEAARILIDAFGDSATRGSAIAAMQVPEADLFYTQSMLPAPRDLMADYPELASEYAKYARDLPEAFIPRAALLRTPLNLPDWQ